MFKNHNSKKELTNVNNLLKQHINNINDKKIFLMDLFPEISTEHNIEQKQQIHKNMQWSNIYYLDKTKGTFGHPNAYAFMDAFITAVNKLNSDDKLLLKKNLNINE